MQLEFHQLDLRYQALRRRSPDRERRLLASLAAAGQQQPVIVVRDPAGPFVLVDGYKRVRALRQLKHDTVLGSCWDLDEVDALILERLMRTPEGDTALEQGWLLCELGQRFGLTVEEIGHRFDKSPSWVSRRQALVKDLPAEVQELVRTGAIGPHAAMKHLVPLARANGADCVRLAAALAPLRPSSRQVAEVHAAWTAGNAKTRALLVENPALFLRAREEARRSEVEAQSPVRQLLGDLGLLEGVARRAQRRLSQGLAQRLTASEREEAMRCLLSAQAGFEQLVTIAKRELGHAG